MSGSGFGTAASDLDALNERINDARAQLGNMEFPGQGTWERRFAAACDGLMAKAEGMGDWATDAATTCREQDTIDHGLELAPTPAALDELFDKANESGALEDVKALEAAAEARKLAEEKHETATVENALPPVDDTSCTPTSPNTPSSSNGDPAGGEGEGTLAGEGGEDDATEGGIDPAGDAPSDGSFTAQPPSTLDAPVVERARPASDPTLSDIQVSTETSADTMAPATGAGSGQLNQPTQATSGGQPIQGTNAAPNPMYGASGGQQQLGQPAQGARGGTPQSPEKRREAQDRQEERDATLNAATGTAAASSAGLLAGGLGSAANTPNTNTSGAQSIAPASGTSSPSGGGGGGQQGGAMGGGTGGVRPMGNGENVNNLKPREVIASQQPDPVDIVKLDPETAAWLNDILKETEPTK